MRRILYHIVDGTILILCLPFYAVAIPAVIICELAVVRLRKVRRGKIRVHWPAPDVREDLRVVDLRRLGEGLVGVRRRRWNVLYHCRDEMPPPSFSDQVESCTVAEFWLGPNRLTRRRRRVMYLVSEVAGPADRR